MYKNILILFVSIIYSNDVIKIDKVKPKSPKLYSNLLNEDLINKSLNQLRMYNISKHRKLSQMSHKNYLLNTSFSLINLIDNK